jgi:hypothetical protein
VDPRTAATRLGHSDVRLTLDVYARALDEADRAAAEAAGEWLTAGRDREGAGASAPVTPRATGRKLGKSSPSRPRRGWGRGP